MEIKKNELYNCGLYGSVGAILGYLYASLLQIPPPPAWFWTLVASSSMVYMLFLHLKYKVNNDSYGDIDEQL